MRINYGQKWPCNFLATQRHCRKGTHRGSKNKALWRGEETHALARNKEKHTQEIGKMERMPFTRRKSASTVWGLWVQRKQGNWSGLWTHDLACEGRTWSIYCAPSGLEHDSWKQNTPHHPPSPPPLQKKPTHGFKALPRWRIWLQKRRKWPWLIY